MTVHNPDRPPVHHRATWGQTSVHTHVHAHSGVPVNSLAKIICPSVTSLSFPCPVFADKLFSIFFFSCVLDSTPVTFSSTICRSKTRILKKLPHHSVFVLFLHESLDPISLLSSYSLSLSQTHTRHFNNKFKDIFLPFSTIESPYISQSRFFTYFDITWLMLALSFSLKAQHTLAETHISLLQVRPPLHKENN